MSSFPGLPSAGVRQAIPPGLPTVSALPPPAASMPPGAVLAPPSSSGSSSGSRTQPRHKVVFDLHLQHLALYDQPDGRRPLEKPMLWQASDERGALKFRLRTRSPPSICLLMDDSQHEMLVPLSYITSLRVLSPPTSSGAGSAASSEESGSSTQKSEGRVTAPSREGETEKEMEERLRAGGIVIELGIMKGCAKEFRLREPNRYVRLGTTDARPTAEESGAGDFTGGAAQLTNFVRMTIHASVTPELSHSMAAIVIRALRVRDGQLPHPSPQELGLRERERIRGGEGGLSKEGFVKRGWKMPEHLLGESEDEGWGAQRERRNTPYPPPPRPTLSHSSFSQPLSPLIIPPVHPPPPSRHHTIPPYGGLPAVLEQHAHARLGSLDPGSPPSPSALATPMPTGLLPSDLFVDDAVGNGMDSAYDQPPRRVQPAHAPLASWLEGEASALDPERTPMNRGFGALGQAQRGSALPPPDTFSRTTTMPPITPPTPPAAVLPVCPPLGRACSLGISTDAASFLLKPSAGASVRRAPSFDSPLTVPDSYWQPRSRSSSASSGSDSASAASHWSVGTVGTDDGGSLTGEDVEYLAGLALDPERGAWAPAPACGLEQRGVLSSAAWPHASTTSFARAPSLSAQVTQEPPRSRTWTTPPLGPALEAHHRPQRSIPLPPPSSGPFSLSKTAVGTQQEEGGPQLPFYPVLAERGRRVWPTTTDGRGAGGS